MHVHQSALCILARVAGIWVLYLHKSGPIRNLGGNILYKRQPTLCISRVHFWFPPEAVFPNLQTPHLNHLSPFHTSDWEFLLTLGKEARDWQCKMMFCHYTCVKHLAMRMTGLKYRLGRYEGRHKRYPIKGENLI